MKSNSNVIETQKEFLIDPSVDQKSNIWTSYEMVVEPLSPEQLAEERARKRQDWVNRNPHFFINIDNFRDIWTLDGLKHVRLDPQDERLHSTHTVRFLCSPAISCLFLIYSSSDNLSHSSKYAYNVIYMDGI